MDDALTVVAALIHVGRPLTFDTLAAALDWTPDRTSAALDAIQRRPAITDPLVLRTTGAKTYALTARPDRLSPAQREALEK